MSAKQNGHAAREQLALEVQAEALRPTPQVNGPSLQERVSAAWRRCRELEERVTYLQKQNRENQAEYLRELATQRRELMAMRSRELAIQKL